MLEECVEFKVANHPDKKGSKCFLDDAVENARKIDTLATPCRERIGACVYKVVLKKESQPPDEVALKIIQEEICDKCSPDAVAWVFPKYTRDLAEENGDYYVPGVVLAMRVA